MSASQHKCRHFVSSARRRPLTSVAVVRERLACAGRARPLLPRPVAGTRLPLSQTPCLACLSPLVAPLHRRRCLAPRGHPARRLERRSRAVPRAHRAGRGSPSDTNARAPSAAPRPRGRRRAGLMQEPYRVWVRKLDFRPNNVTTLGASIAEEVRRRRPTVVRTF
jgi:hypothetical protein